MAKSQMQLANRAWRNATANLGWNKATPKHSDPRMRAGMQSPFKSKKAWKKFCRSQAETSVEVNEQNYQGAEPFTDQGAANWSVEEELSYWDN